MSDSVKMVFKTIFITILSLVFVSLAIELFNVNITGLQIRHMSKMAARQAAVLFSQETYKQDNGGTVAVEPVVDNEGATYISGDFYYGLTNASSIYYKLYGPGSNFSKFCNMSGATTIGGVNYELSNMPGKMEEIFTSLESLRYGVDGSYVAYLGNKDNKPSWNDADNSAKVKRWNIYSKAKTYIENKYTPINLGIAYLDPEVMQKMYKWNLAKLASNDDSDLIQTKDDGSGAKFVNYKGFRIYADAAQITGYQYKVFDLSKATDRHNYTALTNNLVNSGAESIHIVQNEAKENNYVTVVSIQYNVPIEYEGITPIRRIFNYVWSQEVEGMKGEGALGRGTQTWNNDDRQTIATGNTDDYLGTEDAVFTSGYLMYSIVN